LLFIVFVDDLLDEINETGGLKGTAGGEEFVVGGLMYADDLEVLAPDDDTFRKLLAVVGTWCEKWRMRINLKKSEVVVFGDKGGLREEGWELGEGRIMEKEETICLGMIFNKNGSRDGYRKNRTSKVAGIVSLIPFLRRTLGEQAALTAWRVFVRTVLVVGCEVMVWDRCGIREKMDVIQRSALRGALGLDRGANNALLIGEAGGGWVSEDARWMALRYGCFVGEMKEGRLLKKVNGKRDRWVRYIREVQRELQTDLKNKN
jgi:hypothetical protein